MQKILNNDTGELLGFPDEMSLDQIDTEVKSDQFGTISNWKPTWYDRTVAPALKASGIDITEPGFLSAKKEVTDASKSLYAGAIASSVTMNKLIEPLLKVPLQASGISGENEKSVMNAYENALVRPGEAAIERLHSETASQNFWKQASNKFLEGLGNMGATLPIDIMTGGAAKEATLASGYFTKFEPYLKNIPDFAAGMGLKSFIQKTEEGKPLEGILAGAESTAMGTLYGAAGSGLSSIPKMAGIGLAEANYNALKQGRLATPGEMIEGTANGAAMGVVFHVIGAVENGVQDAKEKAAISDAKGKISESFDKGDLSGAMDHLKGIFQNEGIRPETKQALADTFNTAKSDYQDYHDKDLQMAMTMQFYKDALLNTEIGNSSIGRQSIIDQMENVIADHITQRNPMIDENLARQAAREWMQNSSEELTKAQEFNPEKENDTAQIYSDVKRQLLDSGHDLDVAEHDARIWEAMAARAAKVQGLSPAEWYLGNKFEISRGTEPSEGNYLRQAANEKAIWEQRFNDWKIGKMQSGSRISLGNSFGALELAGADKLELFVHKDVLDKASGGKHEIQADDLKALPEEIANPIMIFQSATQPDALVVLTEITGIGKTGKKESVVAAIHLNKLAGRGQMEINSIASIHPRPSGEIANFADWGLLRYANKEKANRWLRTQPAAIAGGITKRLADKNIPSEKDLVNPNKLEQGEASLRDLSSSIKSDMFYSKLQRSIEEKMPNVASAEQIKGIIEGSGVKQEEVDWSGLKEFLGQKQKVSKQDVLDFLKGNQVQIKEVTKGDQVSEKDASDAYNALVRELSEKYSPDGRLGINDFYDKMSGDDMERFEAARTAIVRGRNGNTKFQAYQLPGGENYREMLLTLPDRGMAPGFSSFKSDDGTWGIRFPNGTELTGWPTKEAAEKSQRNQPGDENFKSSHFDEPNILAHVRFNDRTDSHGQKTLFIEEIQSDWHQRGRKEGYLSDKAKKEITAREDENVWVVYFPDGKFVDVPKDEVSNAQEAIDYAVENERMMTRHSYVEKGVPDAPFKKSWHELALKRILRMAVEEGYDKIAWTTGEQQADRYDLSKQVDDVRVMPNESGSGKYFVEAWKDGKPVIAQGIADESKLSELIGKDLSKKAIDQGADQKKVIFSGENLKIGGEGMKGFYDQIIPAFLNKYTKKWGGRVGKSEIVASQKELDVMNGEEKYPDESIKVHSLEITPSMKESVLKEGQPLFQGGKSPRGWVELSKDPEIAHKIVLAANADASTFMHETAHIWLHDFKRFIDSGTAGEGVRKDWDTLKDWLKFGDDQKELTVDQHEKFARGFERYLREGKAPSAGLAETFERFKTWLSEIYKNVRQLKAPITDDVRSVMDRMLADEENPTTKIAKNEGLAKALSGKIIQSINPMGENIQGVSNPSDSGPISKQEPTEKPEEKLAQNVKQQAENLNESTNQGTFVEQEKKSQEKIQESQPADQLSSKGDFSSEDNLSQNKISEENKSPYTNDEKLYQSSPEDEDKFKDHKYVKPEPLDIFRKDTDKATAEEIRHRYLGSVDKQIVKMNQQVDAWKHEVKDKTQREGAFWLTAGAEGDPEKVSAFIDTLESLKEDDPRRQYYEKEIKPQLEAAINLSPEALKMIQEGNQYYTEAGKTAYEMGTIRAIRENYQSMRLYKPEPPEDFVKTELKGGLKRSTAHSKQRVYDNAFDAVLGGKEFKTTDYADLAGIHNEELAYVNTARQLTNEMSDKDTGLGKWVRPDNREEGWEQVGKMSRTIPIKDKNGEAVIGEDGNQLHSHSIFVAPEQIAKGLSSIVDPNYLRKVDAANALEKFNGFVKSFNVAFSFFHHFQFVKQTLSSYKGESILAEAPKMLEKMQTPEFKEMEQYFHSVNGRTTMRDANMDIIAGLKDVKGKWIDKLAEAPGVKQAIDLTDKNNKILFDYMQRFFKVMTFGKRVADWNAKNPDASDQEILEAHRGFAKAINTTFGGLNWEDLGITKTTRSVMRLGIFAPDWLLSMMLHTKAAATDWSGTEGHVARANLVKGVLVGAAFTQALNYLTTGHFTDKNKKGHFLDWEVSPGVYTNFFGGATGELLKFVSDVIENGGIPGAVRYLSNKSSPFGRALGMAYSGVNYSGQNIWKDKNILGAHLDKNINGILELASTVAPIPFAAQASSAGYLLDKDAPIAGKAVVASGLGRYSVGNPERDQQEFVKNIKEQYFKGNQKPLDDAVESGQLTKKEAGEIQREGNLPERMRDMKHMSAEKMIKKLDGEFKKEKLTGGLYKIPDDERDQLLKMLREKVGSAQENKPAKEFERIAQEYEDFNKKYGL